MLRIGPALLLSLVMALSPLTAAVNSDKPPATAAKVATPRLQRIADAGRLWGQLKWLHPALADGAIDWDKALIEALPELDRAQDEAAYLAALRKLVAPLGDGAVLVGPNPSPLHVKPPKDHPSVQRLPGDIALVNIHGDADVDLPEFAPMLQQVKEGRSWAKGWIIDLRPEKEQPLRLADAFRELLAQVVADPVEPPYRRFLHNRGYFPQTFSATGGYYRALVNLAAEPRVTPATPGKPLPLAFILGEGTSIPEYALALQKDGKAFLVSAGNYARVWSEDNFTMDLAGGIQARIPATELVFADGQVGFGLDVEGPSTAQVGPESPVVRAALDLLRSGQKPGQKVPWRTARINPANRAEKAFAEMTFPALPYRHLAVIRFWDVVTNFFPYLELMDRPWESALPEFLEKMDRVNNATEYALVMAEMASRLQDDHVVVSGHPSYEDWPGKGALPAEFRLIEGRMLVVKAGHLPGEKGLHVGDEVLELNGRPLAEALNPSGPGKFLLGNSGRKEVEDHWTARFFGWGPVGTTVTLTVRGTDGVRRSVTLERKVYGSDSESKSNPVHTLQSGTLYVDLRQIRDETFHLLQDKLTGAQALILDMRGYPRFNFDYLAELLNVKGAKENSQFMASVLAGHSAGWAEKRRELTFGRNFNLHPGKPPFTGKVVMLIDERAISAAEHACLIVESCCDVTFIGSPTIGANGDVTDTVLPGGVTIRFTGQGVRHLDGRQLQRVGIQPHIRVRPTFKGMQEGGDEVLDRALDFLRTGK